MGPNISSFMILLSLVMLSNKVGSIYKSSLELLPPKQHYLYMNLNQVIQPIKVFLINNPSEIRAFSIFSP